MSTCIKVKKQINHACDSEANTKIELNIASSKEITHYACTLCDFSCLEASDFKNHQSAHTMERKYSCKECDYSSNDASNFKNHLSIHSDQKPTKFKNDLLEKFEQNSSQLEIEIDFGYKKFICSFCDYTSVRELDIRRHTRTHTGEKPYACELCDYKTLDKGNLTKHKRRHTGEAPYSCNVCDYTCRDSSNLKKHLRIHTGDRPYRCTVCEFKSSCPANLKSHIRVHNKEDKPFKCEQCKYRSTRLIDLKRHMKIHGDRLYSCKVCEFRSRYLGYFKNHIKRHSNYHKCDTCDHVADTEDALNNHMKSHVKENNSKEFADASTESKTEIDGGHYSCSLCNVKFLSMDNLKIHLESHAEHYLQNFKHFLDID